MGLGYKKKYIYPRLITLAKRYLWFYRCHRPYMLDKTDNVSLYLIKNIADTGVGCNILNARFIAYYYACPVRAEALSDDFV